jgi:Family of unknown function (DUF6130)
MKRNSMLAIAIASALVVLGGTAISAQDAGAFAQSSVVNVENEPAPSLIVLPPLRGPLAQGVVLIPYRLENLRIVPVGGAAARDISPRVGHLHITLDDLPWQWADVATGKMTADEAKADCGHTCHVAVKGKDYIFHPYQTR